MRRTFFDGTSELSPRVAGSEYLHSWQIQDSIILLGLLILAAGVRLAFFNGPFGSDDVVYLARAIDIAQGTWSSADYNGALRYGFNIPAGLFIYLFGVNLFAANLWPLLCSLAEIAVVYVWAAKKWGRREAIYSALILLSLPLHIAVSTRIHADPVVSFFLTLSFVLFFLAEAQRSRLLFFVAGIAMGLVFWAKELALVTLFAFALYPLVFKKLDSRWLFVISGGIIMLVAHLILMTIVSGDPLHLFKVVTGQINRSFIGQGMGEDSVLYYLWYLFIDIKHTWIAPFFAFAVIIYFIRKNCTFSIHDNTGFVIFWLISLLLVLSITPVSLDPLRFAMKQSNYLTLFLAPIALLAGFQIARIPERYKTLVLMATVLGGVELGALEQQAYHVFTSNSKGAVEYAKANPEKFFLGSVNNSNMAQVYAYVTKDSELAKRFGYLNQEGIQRLSGEAMRKGEREIFLVLDKETIGWSKKDIQLAEPLPCWRKIESVTPSGFGLGKSLTDGILNLMTYLPDALEGRLSAFLKRLSEPAPAAIFLASTDNVMCEL